MTAVVRIAGTQASLHEDDVVRVPRLDAEEGATLRLDDVLLLTADGQTFVGQPTVDGAAVQAVGVRHPRGKKIEVATFKRRKDFRKHIGHRTDFTEIRVTSIAHGESAKSKKSGT